MKFTSYVIACAFLLFSTAAWAQETERVYLSGRDKDNTVPWTFMCTTGAKSGEWTTIPVPSNWDVLGFGMLNYKKDIETALEEHGLYEHEFSAPSEWSDERVFIVFEGSMTDTLVKINGKQAGPVHQGGFYRFKHEITPLLKFGAKNLLEVDVAKHSANQSVNKAERTADFWVFGGIYRPVYLEVVPKTFIERVAINAQADGKFTAEVFVNKTEELAGVTIEAQIQTLDGESVGNAFAQSAESMTTVSTQIEKPRQWTAETPNLYQVRFSLKKDDKEFHTFAQRFGFRTIEVRPGDGIYVNGQRVVLKGVNRHSTWPDSGRCLSEEVHRLDIETIQDMNMNAVRMSHYPPDQEFLDLCDELGLYVLDELAGWHWHYDTATGRKLVESLVTRDVNHPSVLFWDNGNEGGFNVALDEVFGQFDPQGRKVLHAWEAYNFINTAHYLEYDRAKVASQGAPTRHGPTEVYQEWEDLSDPNKYIYMPTEMLHGLYDGGGGAGLAEYWSMMQESPLLGGAFLWVLFDEGIKRPDGTIDCAGNQAPDGIVGPYREREASFYTVKELWSPIQITRNDDGTLTIKNEYSFTNASECQLTWQLRRLRRPNETESGFTVVAEKKLPLPAVTPGQTGSLKLDLPETEADILAVRVVDPKGRELWNWTWPLQPSGKQKYVIRDTNAPLPQVTERPDSMTYDAGNLSIAIDKQTGLLKSVSKEGKAIALTNGPKATNGDSTVEKLNSRIVDNNVILEAECSGPLSSIVWSIGGDGWVECEYQYTAEGEHDFLGVTFDYPEANIRGKKWLGDGPFRVWKNRRHGVSFNVWENKYNDTITGYSGWEYPEFKGCFSDVEWLQLDTTEGPITIVPGSSEGFVQVLTPKFPPRELEGETKVNLPKCGLAFLDAIPAVGSKFKTAATTGPQGQPNVAKGSYNGSVKFYFGKFTP
jgi:beta-galactosidase/beta-glucuronidase